MKQSFRSRLVDLILSGHALIHVRTPERHRFTQVLKQIVSSIGKGKNCTIKEWSMGHGWKVGAIQTGDVSGEAGNPEKVSADIVEFPEDTFCVLYDFGMYLDEKRYNYADVVVSQFLHLRQLFAASGKWVFLVGNDITIPKTMEHDIVTVDFDLPCDEEIEASLDKLVGDLKENGVNAYVPETRDQIIAACRGMTDKQIEDRLSLAVCTCKKLDESAVRLLLHEKSDIIRQTGLLTYQDPPEGGLDRLGGWDNVKERIRRDARCFTHHRDATEYGIPYPKGLLLVGIPGCGKTAMSLAISSFLNIPLIQMDVGTLMSKWVGESEQNMRNALKLLERIAPCVLQVDEIEKGFSGVGSEDSGASVRTFGTFLKWLNDRVAPVYTIATANSVDKLPPEFFRKGRFDEIYGVYLPTLKERAEILDIHLHLVGLGGILDSTGLQLLAKDLIGFTGADIQQLVCETLKSFWNDGVSKKNIKSAALTSRLDIFSGTILPFSKTNTSTLQSITSWMNSHTRPASNQEEPSIKRRVNIGEN